MTRSGIVTLAFLSVLAMIGYDWHRQSQDPMPQGQDCLLSRRDSVLAAIYNYGVGFGNNRVELRDTLGAPLTTSVSTTVNNPPFVDSVIVSNYGGMAFTTYWRADGREFLTDVEMTSRNWHPGYGIRVGSTTKAELTSWLVIRDSSTPLGIRR